MRWIVIAAGLTGCTGPDAEPPDPNLDNGPVSGEPSDPSDPLDPGEPSDPGAAEAQFDEAVRLAELGMLTFREMEPDAVERTNNALMNSGDAQCPTAYSGFWLGPCSDTSGTEYEGYVYAIGDPSNGYTWYMYGEGLVTRADGSLVALAGSAAWASYAYNKIDVSYHYGFGVFYDEGADTWLGDDYDVSFIVQAQSDGGGKRQFVIDGELGGLEGNRSQAVDFETFTVDEDGFVYPACPDGGVFGSIWARTADAVWLEVAFGDDCDACAEVFDGSQPLGEACFDTSMFLDWEVSPW